jgi:hypothetical protein
MFSPVQVLKSSHLRRIVVSLEVALQFGIMHMDGVV